MGALVARLCLSAYGALGRGYRVAIRRRLAYAPLAHTGTIGCIIIHLTIKKQ